MAWNVSKTRSAINAPRVWENRSGAATNATTNNRLEILPINVFYRFIVVCKAITFLGILQLVQIAIL